MFLEDDRYTYDFSAPGLWPDESQELILKAALLKGEEALAAWELWRSQVDLEGHIDSGTFRLLPLLYQKLLGIGVEDPLMRRLASVYRWSWVESNQILRYMRPLLQELHDAGIETLLLKGAPLAYAYYALPGMRPMADFDVLVRRTELSRTIDFVRDRGWRPCRGLNEQHFEFRHSSPFVDDAENEFDLHWHALREACDDALDAAFWKRSIPFEFEGIRSRRLDSTDSLLHTIAHGIRWNPEPPIRWIADAIVLLEVDGDRIDWPRLISIAEAHGLSYRIAVGLRYLQERMGADIPRGVLEQLASRPLTFVERLERHGPLEPPAEQGMKLFHGLIATACEYLRYREARAPGQEASGFTTYLSYRKGLSGKKEIGTRAARHVWRWSWDRLNPPARRNADTSQ